MISRRKFLRRVGFTGLGLAGGAGLGIGYGF
jgi:hypothetical protein